MKLTDENMDYDDARPLKDLSERDREFVEKLRNRHADGTSEPDADDASDLDD